MGSSSRSTRRRRSSSASASIWWRREALSRVLPEKYGLASTPAEGGLTFLVEAGDPFIVKLLTSDRPPLEGISVRRPTLDDVFLSLTGRQIRAEGAEGNAAKLRALVRRRG